MSIDIDHVGDGFLYGGIVFGVILLVENPCGTHARQALA